jgi:putative Holliday junction resolvase
MIEGPKRSEAVGAGRDRPPQTVSDPSQLPTAGRLLGVDIGDRRIGLALSDPTQTIAQPLETLTRRLGKRFPLTDLASRLEGVVGVVVGLPLTPEGTEGGRAVEARTVAQRIARRFELPVMVWDERFTTARALATARELNVRVRNRRADTDRIAATVLLQHFLEVRRGGPP